MDVRKKHSGASLSGGYRLDASLDAGCRSINGWILKSDLNFHLNKFHI